MKVSDYIVEFLIQQGIHDVFGYPGGMVTHLMDSLRKYSGKISSHLTYNEQGAAFAACGYAQASGKVGVAYATSGPGATNLITGICNAYMDSIPTVFITGQVNSFEQKGNSCVRQRGFQEADIVSMVTACTKYAVQINHPYDVQEELQKAFYLAIEGRPGPVLLDIAMDVFRADIEIHESEDLCKCNSLEKKQGNLAFVEELISNSRRPAILVGHGISYTEEVFSQLNSLKVPVVSSIMNVDIAGYIEHYFGFVGAYGSRTANFILEKCDLLISLGARLDIRQVGRKRDMFAPHAKIIRVDVDPEELRYSVHSNDVNFCMDAGEALGLFKEEFNRCNIDYQKWLSLCKIFFCQLQNIDDSLPNRIVKSISQYIPAQSIITADVGQNQLWVAQSFAFKKGQRAFFSGGFGAMGYSLPASIGASVANRCKVFSFNGDGGIQMNLQELQVVARDQLPIKIFVFNNSSLGMIRHFQELYFKKNYFQTTESSGYSNPDFEKISNAYGLSYFSLTLENMNDKDSFWNDNKPAFIEIKLPGVTYVSPKLRYGMKNCDQEPLLDRQLFAELMNLSEENMSDYYDELQGKDLNGK